MKALELLILNLEEVRRRSIKVWHEIPEEYQHWKPDETAMSCIEMVRHVLEAEHYYHQAILERSSVTNYESPFEGRAFATIEEELQFAKNFREEFLQTISDFSEDELTNIIIDRSDVGYKRSLGDMLLRIAYHESIHTGQLLDYLRTAGVTRANIWD